MSVPSINVNKVCLSGLNAIYLADQMIAAGEADIVVAGGMESMTNAPYLADGARGGFRYGNVELADAIIKDGLWCAFDACLMGSAPIDTPPTRSPARSRTSSPPGRTSVPPTRSRTDGSPTRSSRSRCRSARVIRSSSSTTKGCGPARRSRASAALRPAFDKEGTITAGNASQLSDGASAVVVMSSVPPRTRAASRRSARSSATAWSPGPTTRRCCTSRAGRSAAPSTGPGSTLADVDLFEINEAFAAVGIASMRELGIGDDVVNVNGGAIALGHPIGMSGNRLALTLLHELKRRGGGLGAAALCGGGGQGDALVVRAL